MVRHLLVPMDDSEPARSALEHALSVFSDAEITVVHAVDDLEEGYGSGAPAEKTDPEFFEAVRAMADEDGRDRTVETAVIEGSSPEAILEYADAEDVDQIVMGSAGRSGVSRMLLGSVAEGVTRKASIPVTIVPGPTANRSQ